jgi:nucleoid-associated protein YgaU
MGLIAFLKDAGEKLFGHSEEIQAAVAQPTQADKVAAASAAAGEAIKRYLQTQHLPADDLTIGFNAADRMVTVAGAVDSQETREKVILCCGNVDGVAGVHDELICPEGPACQYHTVVRGDTLSAIAKKFYGNANAYMKIFDANKPMLSHPDKIYPGQNLRIPA